MAKHVSKSAFKAQALAYLRNVENTGEALVVTHRGRPVVRIEPYETANDVNARLRRFAVRFDDPTEPVATEEWEAIA
jgi:prevent-host-death family protein